MHVLPQLRKIEEKYPNELTVISVHSAKFPAERNTENVLEAVRRYNIVHPVVNDHEFQVWSTYGTRAWPTLMFIDPAGKVLARHEGEISVDGLDRALQRMIAAYDSAGLLTRQPRPYRYVDHPKPDSPLLYPGKVFANQGSGKVYIADSNNHRIIEADFSGRIERIFGAGQPGMHDGPANEAAFDSPQGLVSDGDRLLVADTENHAIREVNLGTGAVSTLAGVGHQSMRYHTGGDPSQVALNSPWDLAISDGRLFIAMAGFHQIWQMDLQGTRVTPFLGSGREGLSDGDADSAMLAQPSGLEASKGRLYWVDSETSSVRMANLSGQPKVETIVGEGLFVFGDEDGLGEQAKLQHPLAIAIRGDELFIADSYNHKVKRVFPHNRGCTTYLGDGNSGLVDGTSNAARLYEPGGLSVAGDQLFIADTNNHRIRVADLDRQSLHTLVVTV